MNPLYNQIGNGNGFMDMIAKFNQFKQTFTGDPKQEVMKLLQSGQMSQQQFNSFQSMANQIQSLLK